MTLQTLPRREFLKTAGALVVTFSFIPGRVHGAGFAQTKSVATQEVDGFIQLDPDGTVNIYSGKVDLGTGVKTALTQIAADELDVDFDDIVLIQGDTLTTPDQGPTYGSLSIQNGGMQIRQACATARAALINAAATRFGAPAGEIRTRHGACWHETEHVRYADLMGADHLTLKVDPKAALKQPSDYKLVGKPVPRVDIPAKITGQFQYMHDFRLPGMLHARVIRPAAIQADLISVDDNAARAVPGFVATVREGNFLAVVATSEWNAIRASRAIRAQWSEWQGLPEQSKLWEHVRNTPVVKREELQKMGNSTEALKSRPKVLQATYDFAIHTHGSIGPSCAVAEWNDGQVTCWSASQQTHLLRKQIAQMMKMPESDVRCIYIDGSGCYGRNGHEDAAADAVLIAKAVGKPVRVQWMRADEHGWDPKGPPTLLDFRGALDEQGRIAAWESEIHIPQRPAQISVKLVAADLAGLPHDGAHPGNIHQALAIAYHVPNITATALSLRDTPFRPSWIRTPGRMQNTFGNESFLDELAAEAGTDPAEFRLRHLDDARGRECLERVLRLSGWEARHTPRTAQGDVFRGRGVSYTKYELVRTYVAVVADVVVNRNTGKVRVTRFYVAHDCGQIINPDGLKNQLEGNVIQTTSRTLVEELHFDRSRVTSLDWETYPILTFPDVPELVVDLIDRPGEKPWGAGEPTSAVVPSAIANAIYDATGIRLRSVPITPAKVLAALNAQSSRS
jgi:nicotinate dehydrogenase subunit B